MVSSIDRAASSPFAIDREARITFAALRRVKCRAASRPRPVFAPVTMMVWPSKGWVGYGREANWESGKLDIVGVLIVMLIVAETV